MNRLTAEQYFRSPDFRLWVGSFELHYPTIAMHTHEFWELVIILDGQGHHRVGTETFPIAAGEVFLINSTMAHGFRKARGLKVCNILFEPESLLRPRPELLQLPGYHALFVFEPFFRNRTHFKTRLRLTRQELAGVRRMIDSMEQEFVSRERGYETVTLAWFDLLVVHLSRLFSLDRAEETPLATRLGKVVSHMETHYTDPIRLDELAAITRMSKNHFLRMFKECYRTTPIDYLLRIRVAKACELMASKASLSDIAYRVGFGDSNYFSRVFRRIQRQTPSAYRQGLEETFKKPTLLVSEF